MRQKLIISSALIHQPEVIVVDEPMVGLDPKSARLLKDLFKEFTQRGGTILMSTHTLEVAEDMCDRIGIIQAGKIVACGTMTELRHQFEAGDASLEDLFLRLTGGVFGARAGPCLRPLTSWWHRSPTPGSARCCCPKWRTALARAREERSGTPLKLLLLALVAAGFWSAVFTVAYRVLLYARSAPEIGSFLPQKMLGVILLAFASILLLSNLVTALSTFFLAKDLDMLIAAPIDWLRLYLAKLGETVAHSSWMVALLAVPIFTAYGIVYDGGPWFWLVALGAFVPFLLLPGVIGAVITLVLVNVFPARRTRDLLSLVALAAAGGTCSSGAAPSTRPEPEESQNVLELPCRRCPLRAILPSKLSGALMNWLLHIADPLPLLLWSTAPAPLHRDRRFLHRHYMPDSAKVAGATTPGNPAAWQRRLGIFGISQLHPSGIRAEGCPVFFREFLDPVEPADPAARVCC